MSDFRILTHATKTMGRFVSEAIDTNVAGGVAKIAAERTTGVINPVGVTAGVMTAGLLNKGIFNPSIFERTTRAAVAGTGSSALDDAVRSLHNLGERHGVVGMSLGDDANHYGLIMEKGSLGYEGGGNILRRLGDGDIEKGRDIAFRLDAAARRVLDFVPGHG